MNLTVDIGNKKVKIGVFKNRKMVYSVDFLTSEIKDFSFSDRWHNFRIERCGIASVFPDVNDLIRSKIKKNFKIEPLFLNYKNCKIKIKIKNPEKAGIDRIVNCKGASEIFGYPVAVIDIGTAVTIDLVDDDKNFVGGFILPGPELWVDSLKKTALIKKIENFSSGYIGKDTSSAVNLGMKEGISGAIEKIVAKLKGKYEISKIILTGGWCDYFKRKLNFEKIVRKYLTLEGINIILEENED